MNREIRIVIQARMREKDQHISHDFMTPLKKSLVIQILI